MAILTGGSLRQIPGLTGPLSTVSPNDSQKGWEDWLIPAISVGSQVIGTIGDISAANAAQDTANTNLDLQKEIFEWQKGVQNDIFYREDNAVQRKVADLKTAGLSPVLAAGAGARAGNVVPVSAPQKSQVPNQMRQAAFQRLASSFADISKTVAETKLIEAQKENVMTSKKIAEEQNAKRIEQYVLDNKWLKDTLYERTMKLKSESYKANMEMDIKDYEREMTKYDWMMYKQYYDATEEIIKKAYEEGTISDQIQAMAMNPRYMDYLTKWLMYTISEYDYNVYRELGLPYHGSYNPVSAMLSSVMKSLGGMSAGSALSGYNPITGYYNPGGEMD